MKVLKSVLAVSMALATCGAAIASDGGAGLINGRHDFINRANFIPSAGTVAVGLCTYCHTPHSAVKTALLWNRRSITQTYTWDEAKTAAGTSYPTLDGAATNAGPSVKCLACHDASVAIGDVAWYKGKNNVVYNTFKVGQVPGGTFSGSDSRPAFVIGSGGNIVGTHPVGIPYPDQAGAIYNGVTTAAVVSGYRPTSAAHQVSATTVGGAKSGTPGVHYITNANSENSYVKLYNQAGSTAPTAGPVAGNTGIECSSCHDPHNKQTADDWMLRGRAQGSTVADGYICVQCHTNGDSL